MNQILTDETEEGLQVIVEGLFNKMLRATPQVEVEIEKMLLDLRMNRRHLFVLGFECGAMMAMKEFKTGNMKIAPKG